MAGIKIKIPRGNTMIINFTNQTNNTPPEPISLLGATIAFTVKAPPGYDDVANDSSALWSINSTDNTGNTCTFTSSPVNTWQQPGTYDFDITINYNNGNVVTPVTGTIQIVGIPTNRES